MVKTPKGELTSAELRKLIKAHNILVSIKIPKGTDREGLIKLIESKGYKVDHKKKAIIDAKKDRPRRPKVTLDKAKELTKPKPKTELQKQKLAEAKAEKEEKKKKEVRAIKKEAIEQQKKVMDRKKALKNKNLSNTKKKMKEDEVRPKEKVGRPRFDPKKIKVIEPKKKDKTFMFQDKQITIKDLLDYIDKEGYKISKSQVEAIKYLIDFRKLSKYRLYFNPNGDMVLVPTTNFKSENGEIVDSEMASHFKKNTAILKTILKPKIQKNYSPEEKVELAKTRIKFLEEELKKLKEREKVAKGDKLTETKKQIESLEKSIKGTQKLIDSGFKDPEEKIKFKVGDLIVKSRDKKFSKLGAVMYEVEEAKDYADEYVVRRYLWSEINKKWLKSVSEEKIKIRKTAKGFNWKLASDLPNYKEYVKSDWKENIRE